MNRRMCLWAAPVVLALMSAIPSPSASANTAVLVADAYVNAALPTLNFGAATTLNVGGGFRTFIQFDLSTLPVGLTASNVVKATLRFWVNRIGTPGGVDVADVTSSWSESTVTFNTPPTVGATLASGVPITAAGQWIVVDLTTEVQGWVTTPSANHGIALSASGGSPIAVFLDSKESATTSHEAVLDVVLKL